MYLGILVEQSYSSSSWFNRMYNNLIKTAKVKRVSYKRYDSFEELTNETEQISHIVIIGGDSKWLDDAFRICKNKNSNIIVYSNGNIIGREFDFCCNTISSDIAYSVSQTLFFLKSNNRTASALYAINPRSPADEYLLQLYSKSIASEDIYYNKGNLAECFNEFALNLDKYNSVICANDYSAISLLNHLKQTRPEKIYELFIISYSDFITSKFYSPNISTFSMNFQEFGQATMFICEYFDNPHANKNTSLSIRVPCVFKSRTTTDNEPMPELNIKSLTTALGEETDHFSEDIEVQEITKLEALLGAFDEIDKKIITMLLENQSTTKISEKLFIARSTLKYRIDKMLNCCKCSSKEEMVNLLNKYSLFL